MNPAAVRVLGFAGSLRRGSYNRLLLRQFARALPEHVAYAEAEIGDVPLFNADVWHAEGFPKTVVRLIEQVGEADAFAFATPEYNFSVPGVLKNAIDWVSRSKAHPFKGKPVAMMSASTSLLGGARAQYHLRQILVYLDAHPVNRPEVFVSKAPERFDAEGRLTDEVAAKLVDELAAALLDWQNRLADRAAGTAPGRHNAHA